VINEWSIMSMINLESLSKNKRRPHRSQEYNFDKIERAFFLWFLIWIWKI